MNKETNQTVEISLLEILSSLRKRIVLIILITLIFAGVFWGINKFVLVPTYDSTVKFYIEASTKDEDNPSLGLQAVTLAQRIANTYIELMTTNSFLNLLSEETEADLSAAELKKMITYKSVQDTEILEASVRTTSPELSLKIAQVIAKVAPEEMNKVKANATLIVVDQPLPAKEQSTPKIMRNTALGFVLGLILGSVLAVLIDILDIKIKKEEDITKNFEVKIIGVVPKIK